jgi:uncharacterized repeat protein (TIGR03803 family)
MKRFVCLTAMILAAHGVAEAANSPVARILHQFDGADLSSPSSNLLQLPDGSFVGMTSAPINTTADAGTVFLMSPILRVRTLLAFPADGSVCAGAGSLMQASDGNIYGTCSAGGLLRMGTIFRLDASDHVTVLHTFDGSDGQSPTGPLAEGIDGALYGATQLGRSNAGTLFKITLDGTFTTLMQLSSESGPSYPAGGLTLGLDGNLHGVYSIYFEQGFPAPGGDLQIDTAGSVTFPGYFQQSPWSGAPVIDDSGALYEVGQAGGESAFNQQLQALAPGESASDAIMRLPLYNGSDFVNYVGDLIRASDGNFYMNATSAIQDPVTPFVEIRLDPTSHSTSFFALDNYGESPMLAPLQASDGKLYIANGGGGKYFLGNLMTLNYGLPAPAPRILALSPASGAVGDEITLWGASFVGSTAVSVNGVSAQFTVTASGFLRFAVPAGATSGPISVTNAGGTSVSPANLTVQ